MMVDKTKFIIMGLVGILVISLFLNWQVYSSKLEAERERDSLKTENTSLNKKVEEGISDNRDLKTKISMLSIDIERLTREREEAEKKFEFVNKEREELANKLRIQAQSRPVIITTPVQEQKPPSLPIVDDAYWASVLKAKANLELQLESVNSKLKTLESGNEQLKKDKAALDLEMKSIGNERQELKRQLEYNQKLMDSLAQELVREKNDKFQLQENLENSLSSLKNENTLLKKQLSNLGSQKTELENRLAGMDDKAKGLQKEKTELENKLNVMDSLVKENISQIGSLKKRLEAAARKEEVIVATEGAKEAVELPPIIVRPKTEAKIETVTERSAPLSFTSTDLTGKVLSVNKDSNFIIVDLGEESGIRAGDSFRVYRDNNQEIATVEVIQVRQNISACDIKKETVSIKIGDTIR
jgi:chromosome segregation ATPase